jgi:hypothetical protein
VVGCWAFLASAAVQFLVDAGVRQFLDIGSGVPTVGHVHEIAQATAADARVVYVDIDQWWWRTAGTCCATTTVRR